MFSILNFPCSSDITPLKKYIVDTEEEVKSLGDDLYFGTADNYLTGRWTVHNYLKNKTCADILLPKLAKVLPSFFFITMWANIFRKGEYIKPHDHGTATISGNLFIDGYEDSETIYEEHGAIKNKIGTLVTFPAETTHWVEKNKTDIPRISMAFDTLFFNPAKTYPEVTEFVPVGNHLENGVFYNHIYLSHDRS